MALMMPESPPGDPAREGTCAAWVAQEVLTGVYPDAEAMIGQSHENGWLVDLAMATEIQKYVNLVRSQGGEISVERSVTLNQFIKGTPDAYAVIAKDHTLKLTDLKYGYAPVEPFRNPQVSIYAGAIVRNLAARDIRIDRVELGIYQPRAWHPSGIHRTWVIRPEELMAFVHEIEDAGQAAQNPDAVPRAGAWCEYCPAASTCEANAQANYRIYEGIAGAVQRHMTTIELAAELDFLERAEAMLNARMTAVTAEAEARVKRSEHIPGWHMERRAGQRRFTVGAEIIRALTGIDPEKRVLVTPAELERKKVPAEILKLITETPTTTPKLRRVPPGYYQNLFKGR
jgi:hypothetical protein